MSPTVNNFVHDLVAMAKAMEDLPMVQEKLDQANNLISRYAEDVQLREESIIRLKAEIEAHLTTIRKVEAERDDAELRFLDSEDRTASALAFIKSTFGSAGSLIQALEPPAPTPVVVPANAPVAVTTDAPTYYPEPGDDGVKVQNFDAPSQGQSEPLPMTPAPTIEQSFGSSTPTPDDGNASSSIDPGPMGIDFHGDPGNVDSVSSGPSGERAVDPTLDHRDPIGTGTGNVQSSSEPPVDDVGYHNEPKVEGSHDWLAWDTWAEQMNTRYGRGSWPRRARPTAV
jgi:hypothetical protein